MPVLLPPAATPTGVLRYDWLDPGGVLRDLTHETSPNLFVPKGSAGLGSPGVELVLEKLPTAAGSLLRYTRTAPAEINLPIVVHGDSFASVLASAESLREWFDTGNERVRTPGYLRITRPQDDAVRQIACYYQGGLDGDLNEGAPTHAPFVVSLIAPDPYWTDTAETAAVYGVSDLGDTLGIINTGDYDAYPVWAMHGKFENLVVTNITTGKVMEFTADGGLLMGTTSTLTIDSRPAGLRTTLPVIDQAGTSFFSKLAAGGALWWLVPGANHFTIEADNTDANTLFTLSWLPRHRGVLR